MNPITRVGAVLRTMGSRGSFARLLIVTVGIAVVFGALAPRVFLSESNLQFIALSAPELMLLSIAIALTMLTGGIDLSVVSVANLSAITGVLTMSAIGDSAASVIVGCLAALGVAGLLGAVNGAIVAGIRVTPILATLGTSQLFAGIALVITGGSALKGLPPGFTALGAATLGGVPVVFLIALALAVAVALVVARTPQGVRMRLLGANPTAARYSGFRSGGVLITTYVMSGLVAGVAGLVIAARASGANAEYGTSYVLLAIVVAVLAGVNPDGGYITVAGVVIATMALQFLSSGLLGLGVSSHVVNIAQGVLLIAMMVLNHYGPRIVQGLRARRNARQPTVTA